MWEALLNAELARSEMRTASSLLPPILWHHPNLHHSAVLVKVVLQWQGARWRQQVCRWTGRRRRPARLKAPIVGGAKAQHSRSVTAGYFFTRNRKINADTSFGNALGSYSAEERAGLCVHVFVCGDGGRKIRYSERIWRGRCETRGRLKEAGQQVQ